MKNKIINDFNIYIYKCLIQYTNNSTYINISVYYNTTFILYIYIVIYLNI